MPQAEPSPDARTVSDATPAAPHEPWDQGAERRAFSHSRLGMLDDCPRRYRFRYVDRAVEAFRTVEAFMGTLVHEALQWLYLEREKGPAPSADAVVELYRESWRAKRGPDVRVVQDDAREEDFLDDGEGMLRRHHATTFARDRMETLAVEPRVQVKLGAETYLGYVDRLARDARHVLHVIDYKTGRRMPESAAGAGLQARSYGLAVLERHGGLEVGLTYDWLRHGRQLSETLDRAGSHVVAEQLARRIAEAREVERRGDFPARPGPGCRWCGYRESCDASGHAAAAAAPAGCPLCGAGLAWRAGSRGEMVTCEQYPACPHWRAPRAGEDPRSVAAPRPAPPAPAPAVPAAGRSADASEPALPPDELALEEPA